MAEQKKFYWLKLKKDFFKRHDIQIIESMPNGKDYVLFYLKLMCESIDHEGNLRFSDTIPYNEQMLSTITNTNIDVVRSALKLLQELNMIEILDDHTIYMNEVDKLIGSAVDNDNANRQRRFRERQKENLLLERYESVTKYNESKSIDIEKDKDNREEDKEIDIEKKKEKKENQEFSEVVLRIYDFWNEKKIIPHKTLTKEIGEAIEKALKKYKEEEINTYIDRYAKVIGDKDYFWHYKWSIKDFLTRKDGISSFTDEGSKWVNYCAFLNEPKKTANTYGTKLLSSTDYNHDFEDDSAKLNALFDSWEEK